MEGVSRREEEACFFMWERRVWGVVDVAHMCMADLLDFQDSALHSEVAARAEMSPSPSAVGLINAPH